MPLARPRAALAPRGWLPKVIGYVVAHELGHFVMASREHARRGLMQPQFLRLEHVSKTRNLQLDRDSARLSRFDRALHGKLQRPDLDWLSIAVACGYTDHQHMARDFRHFTGLSPTRLIETQSTSPEKVLGVRHEFDLSYSVSMFSVRR